MKAKKLVDVTYEAMMRGIEAVRPGATLGDIGHAIQSFAEKDSASPWCAISAATASAAIFH